MFRTFIGRIATIGSRSLPKKRVGHSCPIRQFSVQGEDALNLERYAENFETLDVSVDKDGVAKILLNRPDKMNAMNMKLWQELRESFDVVNSDATVRCIILSSTSKHFSSGMDLAVFAEMAQRHKQEKCPGRASEKLERSIQYFQDVCSGAEICNVPVLCAIDGNAIGGAVDLLTSCCLRYCTQQANFSVKEIDLAIVADVGTLQRLPGIVGEQRARELAYTGRLFDGIEAHAMGLVLECFETNEQMMKTVENVAKNIARKSPLTMRNLKRNILYSRDHTTQEGLEHVRMMNSSILFSNDLTKIMTATMKKEDVGSVTFDE